MKIGIIAFFTDTSALPGPVAKEMEALGFESLWVPEHPVMPVTSSSPFPGGGPIPDHYLRMSDQFVTMAMAAEATTTLKLGTGILIVPEHHPVDTAKRVATLDLYSGGRLMLGIGAGWNREELDIMGADFPHRWTQAAEYIAAMRELWTTSESSFEGKYIKFQPVLLYPKPAQRKGPPVYLGSQDRNTLKRVARWGDGWIPVGIAPAAFQAKVQELKQECATAGRDFNSIDLSVMNPALEDRDRIANSLKRYEDAGATRFVLMRNFTRDNYKAELAHCASLYL